MTERGIFNRCVTCRAFDEGVCRHSPPSSMGWPDVAEDDWCEQHKISEEARGQLEQMLGRPAGGYPRSSDLTSPREELERILGQYVDDGPPGV